MPYREDFPCENNEEKSINKSDSEEIQSLKKL